MGTVWDAPNKQVLGLDPPWVEGTGGSGGGNGETPPETQSATATYTSAELDVMTKDDLLAYAQSLGVSPANAAMSKAEIREGVDHYLAGE